MLQSNTLEAFDKATSPNIIKYNLNNLKDDFEY